MSKSKIHFVSKISHGIFDLPALGSLVSYLIMWVFMISWSTTKPKTSKSKIPCLIFEIWWNLYLDFLNWIFLFSQKSAHRFSNCFFQPLRVINWVQKSILEVSAFFRPSICSFQEQCGNNWAIFEWNWSKISPNFDQIVDQNEWNFSKITNFMQYFSYRTIKYCQKDLNKA